MKRLSTAVDDVRLGRKRFSISGSLQLLLLLLAMSATQSHARPQTTNETTATTHIKAAKSDTSFNDDSGAELAFDAGDEYADVDNVEWHHVKIVDGVMHEDHPIIMYKEDFVSEDYDPTQQHTANTNTNGNGNGEIATHPRRKYKNIKRQSRLNHTEASSPPAAVTEKYHALKPEKMYFDILPQSPVVLTDDSSSSDSKPDAARIHVEVISLLDEENDAAEPSKQLLSKHPKKYHHRRLRRDLAAAAGQQHDAATGHVLHKRAPHYTYERRGSNSFDDYAKHLMNYWGQKHPVAGNHWNGIDGDVPPAVDFGNRFGGEDNTDRVVWGTRRNGNRPANRPATTQRPAPLPNFPPLIHNSNPEDADFSHFTTRRPQNNFNNINNNVNNNNRRPATRRPEQQFPSIFHNSNPNDADFSAFTRPPARHTTTTTTPRPPPPPSTNVITSGGGGSDDNDASISQCVWAIVNCCSTSNVNIRYDCFERLGCRGAFWNLNPCADNVKDNILDYVEDRLQ